MIRGICIGVFVIVVVVFGILVEVMLWVPVGLDDGGGIRSSAEVCKAEKTLS